MLEANIVTTILPGVLVKISSKASMTSSSDPEKPRRSTLVLSANSASTPAVPSSAKRWKSNCSPSSGVWSILKSPVWTIMPTGVWMASARQSGMLCVTRRNSISNGPTCTRSRGRTACSRPRRSILCSSNFGSTQRQRQRRCRRPVPSTQVDDVGHGADVILVAVREHEAPLSARASPAGTRGRG